MKRAQARAKCGCGKTLFSTWDKAMKAVVRAGADRPYWCAEGGGYHITRYSRAENARRYQEQTVHAETRREDESRTTGEDRRKSPRPQRSFAAEVMSRVPRDQARRRVLPGGTAA